MEDITCLNGDCLELMKNLPDKSIDLFVCDLPYGCLFSGGGDIGNKLPRNQLGGCAWDIKIDLEKFWIEIKRLSRTDKTPVLMFCNTRLGVDLINSNPEWFRYDLVWNKGYGTSFLLANKMPMKSHELIYVFSKKGSFYKRIDQEVIGKEAYYDGRTYMRKANTYGNDMGRLIRQQKDNKRCPLSIINSTSKKDKRHPTAKPIDLLKWLIERYSNEGDTILDPTAGSFNSGRASIELNRKYIGIEMDKCFYDKNHIKE